jgi:hypothetical protein
MTKAAQQFGKDVYEFLRLPSTKSYLEALNETGKIPVSDAVVARRGVGSFGHPKLAVFFARWLDVRFAVWCDMVIDEIIRGQKVVVEPTPITTLEQSLGSEGVKPASGGEPRIARGL